jgi:hypothetical protein
LLEVLASVAPAKEVERAQSRLMATAPHDAQLSEEAQRMLATAHAVTAALRSATGLDWSVAIIGLCKAVEVEAVRRIAEPLRLAAVGEDMTVELKDPEFARMASYWMGSARPPELGSLARFLLTPRSSARRTSAAAAIWSTAKRASYGA